MGQVITAIGIIRDMPDGGVGSTQRVSPVRSARDDRYWKPPRFGAGEFFSNLPPKKAAEASFEPITETHRPRTAAGLDHRSGAEIGDQALGDELPERALYGEDLRPSHHGRVA